MTSNDQGIPGASDIDLYKSRTTADVYYIRLGRGVILEIYPNGTCHVTYVDENNVEAVLLSAVPEWVRSKVRSLVSDES